MAGAGQPGSDAHLSIGEVLALVQEEFPDITISKIRFLESQGLLDPERTPSGYRKFYEGDIERLQWILAQQRDHFLPLKVIRDRLDEWDATGNRPASDETPPPRSTPDDSGDDTRDADASDVDGGVAEVVHRDDDVRHAAASLAAGSAEEVHHRPVGAEEVESDEDDAEVPDGAESATAPPVADPTTPSLGAGPEREAMTAEELAERAGVDVAAVRELEDFSMIGSSRVGPDTYYDLHALRVVEACQPFLDHGIEVRHLRMYKIAAEREAGVFEQLVMPLLKQRNPEARGRAVETVTELSRVGQELHAALLHHALSQTLG